MKNKHFIRLNWWVNEWLTLPTWTSADRFALFFEPWDGKSVLSQWQLTKMALYALSAGTLLFSSMCLVWPALRWVVAPCVLSLLLAYLVSCRYWHHMSKTRLPTFQTQYQHHHFWLQCSGMPYGARLRGPLVDSIHFLRELRS